MKIDFPTISQISQLRQLWQVCFGDEDAFLDAFFQTAFSQGRCLCITAEETVAAALYWFDCGYPGGKLAYIYAVATHPDYRNRGLCRKLLANTHDLLKEEGYAGAVLVPGEKGLFELYEKMGYVPFGGMDRFTANPGTPIALKPLSSDAYAKQRRQYLPENGIWQENENLAFLSTFASFYGGNDFVFACNEESETLTVFELLGNPSAAPGIVAALHKNKGNFRTPGIAHFAMYHSFGDAPTPGYFGLAFD